MSARKPRPFRAGALADAVRLASPKHRRAVETAVVAAILRGDFTFDEAAK